MERAVGVERRRPELMVTYAGETHPLHVWAKRLGLPYDPLYGRIKLGWTFEEAVGLRERTGRVDWSAITAEQMAGLYEQLGTWAAVSRELGINPANCSKLRRRVGFTTLPCTGSP